MVLQMYRQWLKTLTPKSVPDLLAEFQRARPGYRYSVPYRGAGCTGACLRSRPEVAPHR